MLDHVRRAVSVMLAAAVLLVAPQIAHAAFTGRAAPSMTVGTATMEQPSNVAATSSCRNFIANFGARVNVTSFTDDGPAGATYEYVLYRNGVAVDTETSTNRSMALAVDSSAAFGVGYRVTIRSRLGNWTGPTWERSFTC